MNVVNKTNDGHNVYGYTSCMKVLMWINNWWTQSLCVHTLWKCWHELTIDEWVHCLCVYMFVWNFNNGCEWYKKQGALPFQEDILF